jgi:hypothetical protein
MILDVVAYDGKKMAPYYIKAREKAGVGQYY